MSRLVCPQDPACPVGPDARTCPTHVVYLVPAPDPAEESTGAAGQPPEQTCWQCRHPLPDPAAACCPHCRAGQPPPALALVFPTGTVRLEPGDRADLGRSRRTPHAAVLAAPNISRLHAVAWVDDDGTPWIRDTDSTNGTWVDGEEALPDTPVRLTDGSTLRLAADNRARIFVRSRDQ